MLNPLASNSLKFVPVNNYNLKVCTVHFCELHMIMHCSIVTVCLSVHKLLFVHCTCMYIYIYIYIYIVHCKWWWSVYSQDRSQCHQLLSHDHWHQQAWQGDLPTMHWTCSHSLTLTSVVEETALFLFTTYLGHSCGHLLLRCCLMLAFVSLHSLTGRCWSLLMTKMC